MAQRRGVALLRVRVLGAGGLARDFDRAQQALHVELVAAIRAVAIRGQEVLRGLAPVDSGDLASQIAYSEHIRGSEIRQTFIAPTKAGHPGAQDGYCVDEATEALTQRGWLNLDQIEVGDLVLGIDPVTRQITWTPVDAVNVFDSPGVMHRWSSSTFDALTTGEHRWLAEGSGQRGGDLSVRSTAAQHFTTTEVASAVQKRLILSGGNPLPDGEGNLTDEVVELIGWYLTEGTDVYHGTKADPRPSCGLTIKQSIRHNPAYVERLRALREHFSGLGVTASEYAPYESRWGPIATFYFGKGIGDRVRALCPAKSLPMHLLVSLTAHQRELLAETMLDGDGHRRREIDTHQWSRSFSQQDAGRAEAFQALCSMLGWRTRLRWDQNGQSTTRIYAPGRTWSDALQKELVAHEGRVWCPTTGTGTWLARRAGATYWTGNSYVAVTRFGHRQAVIFARASSVLTIHAPGRGSIGRLASSVRGFGHAGRRPVDWVAVGEHVISVEMDHQSQRLARRIESDLLAGRLR